MARRPKPWFRFYTETFTDPKILRLKPEHRWLWCAVLGLARESPQPGVLISSELLLGPEDIARKAGLSLPSTKRGLVLLAELGMVAPRQSDGAYEVAKWALRQYE